MLTYTNKQMSRKNGKEKISFLAILLACYFMIILCDVFNIGSMGTILRFYALGLIFAVMLYIRRFRLFVDRILVCEILYLLACLFSLTYSIHYETSIAIFVTLLLNFSLIILCETIPYSKRQITILKKALTIGGIVVITSSLFFADYSWDNRLTLTIAGETVDQNFLNGYIIFSFAFFMYRFFYENKHKLWNIIVLGMLLVFTLATGSRGALLAEIAVVLVLLFVCTPKGDKRRRIIIMGATLVILVIVFYDPLLSLLPDGVAERFSIDYIREEGTTGRLSIWKALVERFFSDSAFSVFFGHGVGTSGFYNMVDTHAAHNMFLEVLIGTGLVGLVIFVCLIGFVVKRAYDSQNYVGFAAMVGLIVLGMSLSLITYKPIFNTILFIEIYYRTYGKSIKSERSIGKLS